MFSMHRLLVVLSFSAWITLNNLAQGQLIAHSDSVVVPYDVPTTCPHFSTQLTASATKNVVECTFELCPSDQITIHFCSDGSCTRDTFIELVDTGEDRAVLVNDDYCIYCSGGTYIVDGQSCRTFSLRQGCYGDSTCGGQANLDRIKIYFNPIPPAEVSALSAFYDATNGENWLWPEDATEWDFTNSSIVDNLCSVWHQWHGIQCDCVSNETNCFVTTIELTGMGITGSIEHVPFNRLTFLTTLDLSDNNLMGLIPRHVVTLDNLVTINLASNFLSGTIPSYLTGLNRSLMTFLVLDNHLVGTIPDFFSVFSDIQAIEIGGNLLDGIFPPSMCVLNNLRIFNVGGNNLHGSIPDCFYLNRTFLLDLDLHNNMFTGRLKDDIIRADALNIVKLSSNQFTGTIPPGLFQWDNKAWVFLDRNHFHGSIHRNISRVKYLRDIDFSYNMLTGTLPSGISTLPRLIYMNVEHTKLSGDLHNKFNLTTQWSLRSLVLGANRFTGSLPDDLFKPGLVIFSAYDNCLENYVPKAICNSKTLNTLVLDGMQTSPYCGSKRVGFLSGSKEQDADVLECLISSMPRLRVLHLSSLALRRNALESITSVGQYLDHLSLSYNQLSGTIPTALQTKRWRSLDLSFNFLTGDLVEAFNTVMVDPDPSDDDSDDDGDDGDDDDIIASIPNDDYYVFNASNVFASDISLNINRLSGQVPPALLGGDFSRLDSALSILDGNLFSCNYDKDQIPDTDPAWERYDCGSNSFNASYYFYLATLWFLVIAACAVAAYYKLQVQSLLVAVWSFVVAILSKHDLPRHPALEESDLSNIYLMYKAFDYMEKVFIVVFSYLLLCMTPLYSILSLYYSSYTHSFAWAISAAYKSSVGAAVAETLSFFVFFVLLVITWRHPEDCADVFTLNCHLCQKRSNATTESAPSALDVIRLKPSTGADASSSTKLLTTFIKFCVEVGAVAAMNLLFVYVNIVGTRSQVFAVQVALTVVGLVWSSQNIDAFTKFVKSKVCRTNQDNTSNQLQFSTKYYLNQCSSKMESDRHSYWIQLVLTALNSVWISVITVALVSRSCFYYALITPDTIKSSYVYKTCISREIVASILYCTEYGYQKLATAFTPLFTYSYQCSSVFVVYFAPSIMYTCAIDSFFLPCFQLAASWVLRRRSMVKTVHYAEDDNYQGPSSHGPAFSIVKRKSLYEKAVRLFKKLCMSNLLIPLKVIQVKRATSSEVEDPNMKLTVEELDEVLVDKGDQPEVDGCYLYLRMASHYTGEGYLSATQEAVKVLGYMFLALTFGFAFPPLGVAICTTVVIYIRFLQWKMRSFIEKVWGYAHFNLQGELPLREEPTEPQRRRSLFNNSVDAVYDLQSPSGESMVLGAGLVPCASAVVQGVSVKSWKSVSHDDVVQSQKISRVLSFHVKGSSKADSDDVIHKAASEQEKKTSSEREMALHSSLVALDEQCMGFGDMLRNAKWTVLGTASIFYAFFLFDTAGSKNGVSGSYWTLIALFILPVFMYLLFEVSFLPCGGGAASKKVSVDVDGSKYPVSEHKN